MAIPPPNECPVRMIRVFLVIYSIDHNEQSVQILQEAEEVAFRWIDGDWENLRKCLVHEALSASLWLQNKTPTR